MAGRHGRGRRGHSPRRLPLHPIGLRGQAKNPGPKHSTLTQQNPAVAAPHTLAAPPMPQISLSLSQLQCPPDGHIPVRAFWLRLVCPRSLNRFPSVFSEKRPAGGKKQAGRSYFCRRALRTPSRGNLTRGEDRRFECALPKGVGPAPKTPRKKSPLQ